MKQKLEQLEKQGQEIFIMKKIEQATANVDDREKLKSEKEMLEKAQKETKSVQSNIEKIEDKKLQNKQKQ